MRLTKPQQKAVLKLFKSSPDGAESFLEFRRRVKGCYIDGYCGLEWCNMFVGIEQDGYTHS